MADSFTPEQRAFIREVAFQVVKEIRGDLAKDITAAVTSHANSCTTTRRVSRLFWVGIGIGIGVSIGGGSLGFATGLLRFAG